MAIPEWGRTSEHSAEAQLGSRSFVHESAGEILLFDGSAHSLFRQNEIARGEKSLDVTFVHFESGGFWPEKVSLTRDGASHHHSGGSGMKERDWILQFDWR